MNHVPDEVVAALDRFGEATLRGEPGSVDVALRSDVRVRLDWDREDLAAGRARLAFVVDHPNPADSLRGFGSFLDARVAGVEDVLAGWGVETPADYERTDGGDGPAVYAGEVRFTP